MVLIFPSFKGFSDLEDFWDDLPVSRLKYNALDDFQEVVWTSWKSSDEVFNQMVLIFHSFKGFSDLEDFWDDLPVSRLKYNALDDFQEVFQTQIEYEREEKRRGHLFSSQYASARTPQYNPQWTCS
ncbi:hypothetical protein F2Q69_00034169 [Brassica cretica]|uniref:Uncharacterized protein n=1 Tax=Brassica cretica TaxID=69181 RepID=A0A8S9SUN2_BRACR|nr:hypothetical protein F2Q69_00034169 [Brassica cretica]